MAYLNPDIDLKHRRQKRGLTVKDPRKYPQVFWPKNNNNKTPKTEIGSGAPSARDRHSVHQGEAVDTRRGASGGTDCVGDGGGFEHQVKAASPPKKKGGGKGFPRPLSAFPHPPLPHRVRKVSSPGCFLSILHLAVQKKGVGGWGGGFSVLDAKPLEDFQQPFPHVLDHLADPSPGQCGGKVFAVERHADASAGGGIRG